jgi:hypothetical protein
VCVSVCGGVWGGGGGQRGRCRRLSFMSVIPRYGTADIGPMDAAQESTKGGFSFDLGLQGPSREGGVGDVM